MTYNQAVELVFEQLPAYSKIGRTAIKSGLYNINKLCAYLGDPQKQFRSIHVAGTNGKGSTCHILSSIFTKAGYKTGLYTSPHLNNIRERCRIDGQMISEEIFLEFVQKIEPILSDILPSYFEINVALAFYAFAKEKVDIAIIETGLGGRLDSTNIINPDLSVITNIALDHTDILGETIQEIATEKAGIIKENTPVLIGKTQPEIEKIFSDTALSRQSQIFFSEDTYSMIKKNQPFQSPHTHFKCIEHINQEIWDIQTDLNGDFQMYNIGTALAAIKIMNAQGWNVDLNIAIEALQNVKELSGLKGRWDHFSTNIILDVAHNPDGITQIVHNLRNENKVTRFIYGAAKDKDIATSVKLLPKDGIYYLTQANVPRAKNVDELSEIFAYEGLAFTKYNSVRNAIKKAISDLDDQELLVIFGSFFVVGEAYDYLEKSYEDHI